MGVKAVAQANRQGKTVCSNLPVIQRFADDAPDFAPFAFSIAACLLTRITQYPS